MILMVSPAPPTAVLGNGVTAERWSRMLRALGHPVTVTDEYRPGSYSALIALHARKSADAVRAFNTHHPDAPIVVALTGTDLYPDLRRNGVDPAVLHLASRCVVLQSHALSQLDDTVRAKARVIIQSMPAIPPAPAREDVFEVAFLAHLRSVKDPLLPAAATRLLPTESRILLTHAGAGLDTELAALARAETADNPRYDWLGELPREEALGVLARSRLLVLTSRHEGGANVVSEALAAGVPVVSSAIPGSVGLLGEDYPGYFPVGDAPALASVLRAAEADEHGRYRQLTDRCRAMRELVDPQRELDSWAALLAELSLTVPA
jgi:putative glycosyltransferase (TIGR04348 family)